MNSLVSLPLGGDRRGFVASVPQFLQSSLQGVSGLSQFD